MLVRHIRIPRFTASGSRTSISSNCSGVRAIACSMLYPYSRDQIAVEVNVVVSASIPSKLPGHCPFLHPPPAFTVAVTSDRAVDRRGDSLRREVDEREPIFKIAHRIRKPADTMNDRERTVTLAVELREAARLEPRGHQDHVAAGDDAMRQALVIAHGGCNDAGMRGRRRGHVGLESGIARPEN